MTDRSELWALADGLQMDIRNAQAKLVALRSRLAALPESAHRPRTEVCPTCGVVADYHAADCPLAPPPADTEPVPVPPEVVDLLERLR